MPSDDVETILFVSSEQGIRSRTLSVAPRIAPDIKHSAAEARFLAVGRTAAGRAAFVVFTRRGDRIRPLSPRFMHAKEAARYGS